MAHGLLYLHSERTSARPNAPRASRREELSQPDVTLYMDLDGVIHDAVSQPGVSDTALGPWLGRYWMETVEKASQDKAQRAVDEARAGRISGFRQITQCFPRGPERLMEFVTVRLGGNGGGLLAIGKSLAHVARLQSQLLNAQQTLERDYGRLRDVETRYRVLVENDPSPILRLRAADLMVIEVNPAARTAFPELAVGGSLRELAPATDQPKLGRLLFGLSERPAGADAEGPRSRELTLSGRTWVLNCDLLAGEGEPELLLRLARPPEHNGPRPTPGTDSGLGPPSAGAPFQLTIRGDGVIVDHDRPVPGWLRASANALAIGSSLEQWLGLAAPSRPTLRDYLVAPDPESLAPNGLTMATAGNGTLRLVRLATTELVTTLGVIPAVQSQASPPDQTTEDAAVRRVGELPLKELVKETVGAVERRCIQAALDMTNCNRTAAAELLGLSRQSLYAKLNQYALQRQPSCARPTSAESDETATLALSHS